VTLRIGVVGAAYAASAHLPAYAALAADGVAEVVAVATARTDTAERVARTFGIPGVHVGFESLCADPDVDLVDVATRPSRHRAMAVAALTAGKPVLCEAPLAATTADGEAMVLAAVGAGVVGAVDMQSRYWPGARELRRLVSEGYLGQVQNIAATAFYPTFTRPEAVAASGWCADAAEGASSLRVHGLHTADLIRWAFGPLTRVSGVTGTLSASWPGLDGAVSSADSAAFAAVIGDGPGGGAVCSVHTSWTAAAGSGWRLAAYGSEGVLVASADGHTGHFPIRLEGARGGGALETLVVPEAGMASWYPFGQLVRELAGRLAAGDLGAGLGDVPTFGDGVAALRVAYDVEGGRAGAGALGADGAGGGS
jgi:predicted dehydrogenase